MPIDWHMKRGSPRAPYIPPNIYYEKKDKRTCNHVRYIRFMQ